VTSCLYKSTVGNNIKQLESQDCSAVCGLRQQKKFELKEYSTLIKRKINENKMRKYNQSFFDKAYILPRANSMG
jgi:hypothetical protein